MPHDELARWKAARYKAAQLVLIDRVYAPVFERIEREIAELEVENGLVARARQIVQSYERNVPIDPTSLRPF